MVGILLDYFQKDLIPHATSDFVEDIKQLDTESRKILPQNLELLDITPDYLTVIALIRDVKDLRNVLLQLVMGLPSANK